jgi:hypothetical protein
VSNKHPILDGVRSTEVTAATVPASLLHTHNRRSEARKRGGLQIPPGTSRPRPRRRG